MLVATSRYSDVAIVMSQLSFGSGFAKPARRTGNAGHKENDLEVI
jgi:hypothetical protein